MGEEENRRTAFTGRPSHLRFSGRVSSGLALGGAGVDLVPGVAKRANLTNQGGTIIPTRPTDLGCDDSCMFGRGRTRLSGSQVGRQLSVQRERRPSSARKSHHAANPPRFRIGSVSVDICPRTQSVQQLQLSLSFMLTFPIPSISSTITHYVEALPPPFLAVQKYLNSACYLSRRPSDLPIAPLVNLPHPTRQSVGQPTNQSINHWKDARLHEQEPVQGLLRVVRYRQRIASPRLGLPGQWSTAFQTLTLTRPLSSGRNAVDAG